MKFFSKIKYPILKLIDISGFKVFDPVVRLIYNEEPQKQTKDIIKYMVLPIIFCLVCIWVWNFLGPRHKTKSGEVPTPSKVWDAYQDNKRFDERENEKEEAFSLSGEERTEQLAFVEAELVKLEEEQKELQKKAEEVAVEVKSEMDEAIAPIKERQDVLKAEIKEAKAGRKAEIASLSEKVVAGQESKESLVELYTKHKAIEDEEKAAAKVITEELNLIRDNPPARLKDSQLAANKVADEVQHFKKRIDYLTTGNIEQKIEVLNNKAEEASTALAAATDPKDAAKLAKSVVSNTEKAASTAEQNTCSDCILADEAFYRHSVYWFYHRCNGSYSCRNYVWAESRCDGMSYPYHFYFPSCVTSGVALDFPDCDWSIFPRS